MDLEDLREQALIGHWVSLVVSVLTIALGILLILGSKLVSL